MRLIAMCAKFVAVQKTVQSMLLDGQSALFHCPDSNARDIFSIECPGLRNHRSRRQVQCQQVQCHLFLCFERGIKQIGPEFDAEISPRIEKFWAMKQR